MKDRITNTITRHIGVISESSRGWRLELNMVSWNGAEPKLDIHDWSPDHDRCTSRGTFTKDEARADQTAEKGGVTHGGQGLHPKRTQSPEYHHNGLCAES